MKTQLRTSSSTQSAAQIEASAQAERVILTGEGGDAAAPAPETPSYIQRPEIFTNATPAAGSAEPAQAELNQEHYHNAMDELRIKRAQLAHKTKQLNKAHDALRVLVDLWAKWPGVSAAEMQSACKRAKSLINGGVSNDERAEPKQETPKDAKAANLKAFKELQDEIHATWENADKQPEPAQPAHTDRAGGRGASTTFTTHTQCLP